MVRYHLDIYLPNQTLGNKNGKRIKVGNRVARNYTAHETPPSEDSPNNLAIAVWRTASDRFAPKEWFDLWDAAGWRSFCPNPGRKEDGLIYVFGRKDSDGWLSEAEWIAKHGTFNDPQCKVSVK